MRLIIILFLVVITVSCQTKKHNKDEVVQVNINNHSVGKKIAIDSILAKLPSIDLPYSSEDIIPKVKYYDSIGGYFVDTINFKISAHKLYSYADIKKSPFFFDKDALKRCFLNNKSNIVSKNNLIFAYQNDNDYNYNIAPKVLFPVFKKELQDVNLIGSYSQYFGENDIPGVFFILSSFNKNGKQIDYLIVFNRFIWENGLEIDFQIKEGVGIQVYRKEIEYYDGDLENELDPPRITSKLEYYSLTKKGLFEKRTNNNE